MNTTISYNDINYNFVPVKYEYYDIKTNKTEKIIIITSNFQLNIIKEAKILFIDGTFKSCPRNFYQLLNIVSYLPDKDLIITNLTAVLTSKTETIYNYTLIKFQKLLKTLNINIDFSKISFMADFEINLRKAISDNFPHSEIMGC